MRDYQYGSWFMGKLIQIKKDTSPENKPKNPFSSVETDGLLYVVQFVGLVLFYFSSILKTRE